MKEQVKQASSTNVFILLFAVLLVFAACHLAAAVESVSFKQIINGIEQPIDMVIAENGDRYILDRELSNVSVYNEDGNLKLTFSRQGIEQGMLMSPQAITMNSKGEIFIADTGNSRVLVFDLDGQYRYQLGNSGSKMGEFNSPVGLAIDQSDFIFVADSGHKTISKYSPNGVFLQSWELDHKPRELAIDLEENIYVLIPDQGKIVKYSPEMKVLNHIMYSDGNNDYMKAATSMAVDFRGDIYIIETIDHNIKKIDQSQKLLFSFGSKGEGRGQFDGPLGIEADNRGNIYVADAKNHRVQVMGVLGSEKLGLTAVKREMPMVDFSESIAAEEAISDLEYVPSKGLYALGDLSGRVLWKSISSIVMDSFSSQSEMLKYPKGIDVLSSGEMLVAESGDNKLHFLNSDASSSYSFGIKGTSTSEFNELQDVVLGPNNLIYVSDTYNNRIQVFSRDGIYLNSFGHGVDIRSEEVEKGAFHHPKSLDFDSNGELFVLDTKNRRIQVYSKEGAYLRDIGPEGDIYANLIEPIDMDIDENDYIYIADRGDHRIKILNSSGELITEFGSTGQGPSYFPMLSAVSADNGKIYVADYKVPEVKVFSFGDMVEEKQNVMAQKEEKAEEMTVAMEMAEADSVMTDKELAVMEVPENPTAIPAPAILNNKEVISKEIVFQAHIENDRLYVNTIAQTLDDEIKLDLEKYNRARNELLESAKMKITEKFSVDRSVLDSSINIENEEIMEDGNLQITVSISKDALTNKEGGSKLSMGN